MKILAINCGDTGSSGNLAISILKEAEENGDKCILCCNFPKTKKVKTHQIGLNKITDKFNSLLTKLFGCDGFANELETMLFIKWIKKEKPDVVHIHTLHGHYINAPMLFNFLRKERTKVIWTLHDCWGYTGKCTHYLFNNCTKWKNDCSGRCVAKNDYPRSFILNNAKFLLKKKMKMVSGFESLTIVTVSKWLKNEVDNSHLTNRSITIQNGIEIAEEKITSLKNTTPIILSVAHPWAKTKNIECILETARQCKNYYFWIVGKSKSKETNGNIIFFPKMKKNELEETYKKASVLFNPSLQETFGLVNLEAQSFGVPCIIAKNSGGSNETILEGVTGFSINAKEIREIISKINYCIENKEMMSRNCVEFAKKFDIQEMKKKYYILYKSR